jgi:antitoxin (DNA-binding transcriptional repressor) of toxin-antitoxin stability system
VIVRVDVRQLQHEAEQLVRRASSGEEIVITSDDGARARLVRPRRRTWREWDDLADLFDGPSDHSWATDVSFADPPEAAPVSADRDSFEGRPPPP